MEFRISGIAHGKLRGTGAGTRKDTIAKPHSRVELLRFSPQLTTRMGARGRIYFGESLHGNARATSGRIQWQRRTGAGSTGSGALRGPQRHLSAALSVPLYRW